MQGEEEREGEDDGMVRSMTRAVVAFTVLMVAVLGVAGAGCSRATAPPSADSPQRPFPDIGGATVMLMPVQRMTPALSPTATADTMQPAVALSAEALAMLEAELAYWLPGHAQRTRWVLPEAVERAARSSAALQINVRDLPIGDFQHSSLRSIGDPLFGDLRRIAVVTESRLALVPLGAIWIPEIGGQGRVHVAATLIDTVTGTVLWYGVAAGATAALDDPNGIASAAQAVTVRIPR